MQHQSERSYVFVLICRGCRELRVFNGSKYCSDCLATLKGGPKAEQTQESHR